MLNKAKICVSKLFQNSVYFNLSLDTTLTEIVSVAGNFKTDICIYVHIFIYYLAIFKEKCHFTDG